MKNPILLLKKLLYVKIFTLLFLISASCVNAQTHTPITKTVNDYIKGYWEYLPADYNTSTKKYPLLIFIHGLGELGDGSYSSLQTVLRHGPPELISKGIFPATFTVNGQKFSFIVISPQLTGNIRNEAVVRTLIDYCVKNYRVDESRIYLTGLSMGGGLSWIYAGQTLTNAQRLAALGVVCGNTDAWPGLVANVAKANVPTWIAHNLYDPTVSSSYSINWEKNLNSYVPAINPKAILYLYDKSGHDAWDQTYDLNYRPNGLNIFEWMLQYSRGSSPDPVPNVAPTAAISCASSITLPVSATTLDGTASKDSDGTIKSYAWKFVSGPKTALLSSTTNATTTASDMTVQGNYVFQLTVTDDKGATASKQVTIVVNPEPVTQNTAPIAVITGGTSLTLPTTSTTLYATSSTDKDGSITSYQWSMLTTTLKCNLSGTTSSTLRVSGLATGSYTFQLTVKDDKGAVGMTKTTVTVKDAPNVAPLAAITGVDTISLPVNTVTLDGSLSVDKDGTIASYLWKYVSGPLGSVLTNATTVKATASNLLEGTYVYSLTVTDNKGAASTARKTITVLKANKIPVVYITAPATAALPKDSVIVLDGSTSKDSDGIIKSYLWKCVSGPLGYTLSNETSAKATFRNFIEGTYTFRLVVTDNGGAKAARNVTVVVSNTQPNQPPVAVIKGSATYSYLQLPVSSTLLYGTSSKDPDGEIKSYLWRYISGPSTYLITGASTSVAKMSSLVAGSYVFELVVVDNKGAKGSARVTVLVKPKVTDTATTTPPPTTTTGGTTTPPKDTTSTAKPPVKDTVVVVPPVDTTKPVTDTVTAKPPVKDTVVTQPPVKDTVVATPPADTTKPVTDTVVVTQPPVKDTVVTTPPADTTKPVTDTVVVTQPPVTDTVVVTPPVTDTTTTTPPVKDTTVTTPPPTTTDCGCTKYLTADKVGAINANGTQMNAVPGDVICIKAGKYKSMHLEDFHGTSAKPIIFKNCGGKVSFSGYSSYGIGMTKSTFIKLTGSGSSDKYGFYITSDPSGAYVAIGVAASYLMSDFEIDHVEVQRASSGIWCKTQVSCDPLTWGGNYTMRNVSLHHIYVHDTKGEGFYIGHTAKTVDVTCDGVTKSIVPQTIENLKLYNCITDQTGWDGIQVSAVTANCNVYNNKVTNFGTANAVSQQYGIIFGGRTTGSAYNNIIQNGTGAGFEVFSVDKIAIYNNLITNVGYDGSASGQDGIFIDDRSDIGTTPLTALVANNTIVNVGRDGLRFLNSGGNKSSGNKFHNNIVVNPGTYGKFSIYGVGPDYMKSAIDVVDKTMTYTSTNNLVYQAVDYAKFVDAAHGNFKLTKNSPAYNKGKDLTTLGIARDIDMVARPQGGTFDIGAYELIDSSTLNTTNASGITLSSRSFGNDDDKLQPELKLSPVPVANRLTVTLNNTAKGKFAIRIYDANGRIVIVKDNLVKELNNWQQTIDVAKLTGGMYYLEISSESKKIISKFVVMQ